MVSDSDDRFNELINYRDRRFEPQSFRKLGGGGNSVRPACRTEIATGLQTEPQFEVARHCSAWDVDVSLRRRRHVGHANRIRTHSVRHGNRTHSGLSTIRARLSPPPFSTRPRVSSARVTSIPVIRHARLVAAAKRTRVCR